MLSKSKSLLLSLAIASQSGVNAEDFPDPVNVFEGVTLFQDYTEFSGQANFYDDVDIYGTLFAPNLQGSSALVGSVNAGIINVSDLFSSNFIDAPILSADSVIADVSISTPEIVVNGMSQTMVNGWVTDNQLSINDNSNNILGLQGRLSSAESITSDNRSYTDQVFGYTQDNFSDIQQNTNDISINSYSIDDNAVDISNNESNIAVNTADITSNATDIADNQAGVAANSASITSNASNIAVNTSSISTNTQSIADLTTAVNSSSGAGLATDVAANKSALEALGTVIRKDEETGAIHIGENSLVTVEQGGQQLLYATDANGDAIDINVTNGSDLLVNGRSIMGSISQLGVGVQKTAAMNAAITALPNYADTGETKCGLGVGHYSGQSALAGGCAYGLSEQVTLNLGASHTSNGSTDYGVGEMDSTIYRAGISVSFGAPERKNTSVATVNQLRNENIELRAEVSRLKKLEDDVALLSMQLRQIQTALLNVSTSDETVSLH